VERATARQEKTKAVIKTGLAGHWMDGQSALHSMTHLLDTRPGGARAAVVPPVSSGIPGQSGGGALPAGNAGARLRAFIEQHYGFLWRSLRRLGVPAADVEDAAQQVLIVLHRRLDQLPAGAELAFAFGTAERVASEARRARERRREVVPGAAGQADDAGDGGLDRLPDPAATPEQALLARRDRQLLDQVLDALPMELRTVLCLSDLEEMTMAEIAPLLGIPPGTVASRLRRARARFQDEVQALQARLAAEVKP
jgi:RNA polymerase sigma-70 factor (ECF subfamily)